MPSAAPPRDTAVPARTVLQLTDAELRFGERVLWSQLNLAVEAGQFVAVLGSNGSGKTSLLRVLLGELPLSAGSATIGGRPVRRGDPRIGYVPQRVSVESSGMIKARDLVRLGRDGHRWGPPLLGRKSSRKLNAEIDAQLESVGATPYAQSPVSMLSGGELQRIRIAEALISNPDLLVLDEPLAALDLARQQEVAALMDRQRREHGTSILFVTHEINAVLGYVDQLLYLANGRFTLGTPEEVMTSESLSALYGAPVDVVNAHGRLVVVAANDLTAGLHQSLDDHLAHEPDVHDHGKHHPADCDAWRPSA